MRDINSHFGAFPNYIWEGMHGPGLGTGRCLICSLKFQLSVICLQSWHGLLEVTNQTSS